MPQLIQQPGRIGESMEHYSDGKLLVQEFQRDHLWREGRTSKPIESVYRGLPLSLLLVREGQD